MPSDRFRRAPPVAREVLQPLALYRLDPLDGDGELTIHTELPRDGTGFRWHG